MKLRRNLTALVLGLSTIAACKYKLVLRILWEKLNSET